MTKRQIFIAAVIAAILVSAVFGFSTFMTGCAQQWNAEHKTLSAPVAAAVDAAFFIRSHSACAGIGLLGGSFGLTWLLGRLFQKHEPIA